jgi:uncharacterized protein YndB with AHSA1/START domain
MSGAKGDKARVTVFVAVTPRVAFDVFTQEIDLWWKRGPKFRHSGRHAGTLTFESGPGGRLFETYGDGGTTHTAVVGRVTVWEPAARLVFEWRNENFQPHEKTEVDIRFDAADGGTRVVLEHRGWSALPAGHPARHGLEGAAFSAMIGMWWSELLGALRARVADRSP